MTLTIAIPSIVERAEQMGALVAKIQNIIERDGLSHEVEILTMVDNREMSIGEKRERMYDMARGLYCVQVDDDDDVTDCFVSEICKAAQEGSDCIGYKEEVRMFGIKSLSCHSLRYDRWEQFRRPLNGVIYARTPFCKTPIKTDICRDVGVAHVRFGEDHDFARRVYPFLKTETFIDKVMYIYNAPVLRNQKDFDKRYGEIRDHE